MFEFWPELTDYLLDLPEMTQALIMFGSMLVMILLLFGKLRSGNMKLYETWINLDYK